MGVASLDTYMHVLVYQSAYEMNPMPRSLAQFGINFEDVVSLADQAVSARRREVDGRPRVAAKNALQKSLMRKTFQRYEDVSTAFALAGKKKVWTQAGQQLHPTASPESIKARLNSIVDRRNQIVHEGDLQRQSKPRQPRLNNVTSNEAAADLDYVEALIHAIDAVI